MFKRLRATLGIDFHLEGHFERGSMTGAFALKLCGWGVESKEVFQAGRRGRSRLWSIERCEGRLKLMGLAKPTTQPARRSE
jgi:hypothetical protein